MRAAPATQSVTASTASEALLWYLKAAEQGDAEAQYSLGFRYEHGWNVFEDDREAVMWYSKAAEQGHARAQYRLGSMYANGKGVPEDYREAVLWYRKAAEQGDTIAQTALGVMYANGSGVPQDYVQAYAWINLAAAQGEEMAREIKPRLRGYMNHTQIAEAQKLTRELAETAKIPSAVDAATTR